MAKSIITVWGTGTARTMRVYWTLHEFDAAYDYRTIRTRTSDMDDPAFLKVSPGKKVPALTHGALALTESGAITRYLFETLGKRSRPAHEIAAIDRWTFFTLMEIDATALYVMRRHRDLPHIYGEAPAALQAAQDYFVRQIEVVNDALSEDSEYIVGEHLSEADIHLATCCGWALSYGLTLPDAVSCYHERLRQRRAYKESAAINFSNSA